MAVEGKAVEVQAANVPGLVYRPGGKKAAPLMAAVLTPQS